MGRKLLKTVQTITTFRNPLPDLVGTRRGPPLVRGPQIENRCSREYFPSSSLLSLAGGWPGDKLNCCGSLDARETVKALRFLLIL